MPKMLISNLRKLDAAAKEMQKEHEEHMEKNGLGTIKEYTPGTSDEIAKLEVTVEPDMSVITINSRVKVLVHRPGFLTDDCINLTLEQTEELIGYLGKAADAMRVK